MQISYLLLFIYLLILIIGLVSSSNHVLKSGVCCLISGGLVGLYLLLEYSYANLTSFKSMRSYFYYLLLNYFKSRNLSQMDSDLISGGIFILIVFCCLYLLLFAILTFFAFGDAPKKDPASRKKKAFSLLLYYASWFICVTFIVSLASPAFTNTTVGFLQPLIDFFKWEAVK